MKSIKEVRDKYEGMFPRPDQDPWFPTDITKSSDEELGQLLNLYTLWTNHVSEELSIDDAELAALNEEIEIEKATELVKLAENEELKKAFGAKEDRVAYVQSRPGVRVKTAQAAQLSAMVKIEKAVLKNMESRYSCVSRELTRRGSRWAS